MFCVYIHFHRFKLNRAIGNCPICAKGYRRTQILSQQTKHPLHTIIWNKSHETLRLFSRGTVSTEKYMPWMTNLYILLFLLFIFLFVLFMLHNKLIMSLIINSNYNTLHKITDWHIAYTVNGKKEQFYFLHSFKTCWPI